MTTTWAPGIWAGTTGLQTVIPGDGHSALMVVADVDQATKTITMEATKAETPWPWQDWLAEQWGARSFRVMVLESRAESPFDKNLFWAARIAPYVGQ